MSRSLLIALATLAFLAARPVSAQVQYTLTPLGPSAGRPVRRGINASGQVVGYAQTSTDDIYGRTAQHAFLYSNGTMQDLGALSAGSDSVA